MFDERVKSIISFAYNNSPFYKWFYDQNGVNVDALRTAQDMRNLPILTKEILQKYKDNIIVDKFKNYRSNMIQITRTSGTSGRMIEVLWNKNDYAKSILAVWRKRKKWYNVLPSSKGIVFSNFYYSGSNFLPVQDARLINKNTLSINRNIISEAGVLSQFNIINDFSPEWMQIQPSVALRLIDHMKRYNIQKPSSLRYIELNGEMLTQNQKKYISDFFMVPTANMYGANEVNSIAIDCPNGSMHILEDNVYVESTKEANILVTNLHNHVMPIIRYSLDDCVTIRKNTCCSNKGDIIDDIIGRSIDYVYLENGISLSPYFIIYSIEHVSDILHKCIIQFQIDQLDIGRIIIHIDVKSNFKNWHNTIIEEIKCEIYRHVPKNLLNVVVLVNSQDFFTNCENKFRIFRSNIK